ncbi:MAG TPA: CHASE3 domain-containing protein [Streptosporangiaceae bacterium]|jgi:signal transduction histidine kinase
MFTLVRGTGMGAKGEPGSRGFRLGGGRLIRRTVAVSLLLSAVIGGAFALLMLAIDDLRDSEERANHALEVLVAANRLERLVIDVETSQRGYIITGQPRFLQPWYQARAGLAQQSAALQLLAAAGDEGQGSRARQITGQTDAYIRGYAVPLVNAAQRDLDSARTVPVTDEGKRRIDALRDRFEQFMGRERQIFETGRDSAAASAHTAIVAASVSVAGSIFAILLSGLYLARSVIRPVRRASAMAGRVAGGDLTVRMPETGPGEVGVLENAFNSMAGSLETSRDELRRIAEEQAALRRVATLVARGEPPDQVFSAVAAEAGHLLGAECTAIARFEPDGSAAAVGSWARDSVPGLAPPLGARWPAREASVAGRIRRTGRAARVRDYPASAGDADEPDSAAWAREHGIRSAAGSPVTVESQLWGVIVAFSGAAAPEQHGTEDRLQAFTELVAMAVANTQSRAELTASRARVVAAADQTRRRIERDLHDGTQQRLISLALELRAAEDRVPPGLAAHWSRAAQGLTDVVEELREISRGLHPAILEKGGLRPALRALARRSGVPVELSVQVTGRLPERVEVAAYYVVSEALTNAAKHARASQVRVDVSVTGQVLRLRVADDGAGGADPSRGSGLIGLSDRVAAIGGRIEIASPPGGGTTLLVTIALGRA